MSFNAKNLSYGAWPIPDFLMLCLIFYLDAKDPPFLQKLRGQHGGTAGRLERPIARPRNPKRNNDDDDEPIYVDEESNEVISKEEYRALVQDSNQKEEDDEHATQEVDKDQRGAEGPGGKKTDNGKDAPVSKQKVAEIGGPKKRKQAKVVGEENKDKVQEAEGEGEGKGDGEGNEKQQEAPTAGKSKQKKKKIKLSFDEE